MLRNLFFLLSVLEFSMCSCPTGFDLVSNGQCRGLYANMTIGDEQATDMAIAKCQEIDGLPITIHNDEENSYWAKKDLAKTSDNILILGLICDSNSHRWKWADGSAVDFKPHIVDKEINKACQNGCMWNVKKDGQWKSWCGYTDVDSFDVYCTTQLEQPAEPGDNCEKVEDDVEDGVCYQVSRMHLGRLPHLIKMLLNSFQLSKKVENWSDAQITCRDMGADVASIHNLQENSFIRRLAVSKGAVHGVFIGATDSNQDNQFEWTDGSEWDYDNFYAGFPMQGLGDCIVMETDGTSGQWVNTDCSSKFSVACIHQQNFTSRVCSPGPWKEGELITSPGFPYDASTPCDYMLSVDAGKRVEVEIVILEANSCCDHLIVSENYIGGTVIANLTGEVTDKTYATSSSNFMRVSWQPNGGVNVRGMKFTYRGV